MPFFVVKIALPVPLRRTFDYLPLVDDSISDYQAGQRVRVEFGRQLLVGIVLATSEESDVPAHKLKPLLERLDQQPIVDATSLELCQWLANYYHHSIGDVLDLFLPTMLRRGCVLEEVNERVWQRKASAPDQTAEKPLLKGRVQQALWALFQQQALWAHTDLTQRDFKLAQLRRLAELGYIQETQQLPIPAIATEQQAALDLNDEQQQALQQLTATLGTFQPSLLEGVTGSGKTEVYLQLIQSVLNKQQQVLVLVPEIGLTPQTVQRFRSRFDVPITLLHSGLNDRERLQGFRQVSEGHARILIGTRSAIFTPIPELGLIILDEEHDASFKQQDGLRYSARDFALVRGQKAQVPVVLGSATPSLESLNNALSGRYLHVRLTRRAGKARPPAIRLHSTLNQPMTAGFAHPVLGKMQEHLAQGQQVLVFLNRRGYAPLYACQDCGWMADCRRCDARMTLHQHPPHLHCHHCDFQQSIPSRCQECGSPNVMAVGQGTERIEHQLRELFPNTQLHRVDRDTVRTKHAFDELLTTIQQGEPCILIGTQMLAKGHHFPNVTLVVIVDADGGLFSADFRGMEHSAQLIEQVAGRAGRAESPGEVWIQTLYADHPQLNLLVRDGYAALASSMLEERLTQQLPPYTFMALLRSECEHADAAQTCLQEARQFIQQWQQQQVQPNVVTHQRLTLLGPFPAIMERRAGRFRYQLQIFSQERSVLHSMADVLVQYLEQSAPAKVRWHLDIDPLDTL